MHVAAAVSSQTIHDRKHWVWSNLDEETKETYGEAFFNKIYENYELSIPKFPGDLTPVVRAMRSALLSKRPRWRYQVGLGAGTLVSLFPMMPLWLADKFTHALSYEPSDVAPQKLSQ